MNTQMFSQKILKHLKSIFLTLRSIYSDLERYCKKKSYSITSDHLLVQDVKLAARISAIRDEPDPAVWLDYGGKVFSKTLLFIKKSKVRCVLQYCATRSAASSIW